MFTSDIISLTESFPSPSLSIPSHLRGILLMLEVGTNVSGKGYGRDERLGTGQEELFIGSRTAVERYWTINVNV